MVNKYQQIQNLIGLWNEYEETEASPTFSDFGKWLTIMEKKNESVNECDDSTILEGKRHHVFFYKKMPLQRQFLTLLSRGARFIDFYMRKAFQNLEIQSRLEFQFLISIRGMDNPRKTDIIYFNLVEISTGVETLKRLQNRGLVEDFNDESDKRVKRIRLTSVGETAVDKALKKFNDLDNIANTFGKEDNLKAFIPALMAFNDYHTQIYHRSKDKPFEELLLEMKLQKPNSKK